MKKQNLIVTIALLICGSIHIKGQEGHSCATAIQVCNSDTLFIKESAFSNAEVAEIPGSCEQSIEGFLTKNTLWFKYHFITSGDFIFKIDPGNIGNDIDFFVFEAFPDTCDELYSIRCMTSGETIGVPSESCMGATGLAQGSTDTEEFPGCQDMSDNFLAPISVEAADVLYLAVVAFSGINNYEISHGGTAIFTCVNTTTHIIPMPDIKLYPNPSDGFLTIETGHLGQFTYKILDSNLREIKNGSLSQKVQVDLHDLSSGIYYVNLLDRSGIRFYNERIIHIND